MMLKQKFNEVSSNVGDEIVRFNEFNIGVNRELLHKYRKERGLYYGEEDDRSEIQSENIIELARLVETLKAKILRKHLRFQVKKNLNNSSTK